MNRTHFRWIAPVAAGLALVWVDAGPARGQEPRPAEKVGEKLDNVGRSVKGGLNRAGSATKEQFNRARNSVHNMSVESRVYGRLHWDKALNDAAIELTAGENGLITLTGTVADARARLRAIELARDTVGVTKVVEQLAIRPATTTTTSP